MDAKLKVCLVFLLVGVLLGCSASPPTPSTIRLLDEFDPGQVEGESTEPVAGLTPTEWRFDEVDADQPWEAVSGITGLSVRDGFLKARSSSDISILHVERTSGLENPDVLHAVEVRMRVSEGSQVAVMFSDSEKLNPNAILGQTRSNAPGSWPLRSPLVAGDSIQTYTLTTQVSAAMQSSFPSSGIRHVLVRPTDVAGAEIEIESIRLIFRKEHLANIPSGVSWQGFADVFRETLVTRSPEKVGFTLDLPAGAWFDLAVGTVEDGPVTFQVGLSRDGAGTEVVLLERTVTTPHRWESSPVDLEEFSGQRVNLSLSVRADTARALGFWGAPVIRARSVMSPIRGAEAELPQGVILIVGDTLRRDHLDLYGYGRTTSPVLSRMAAAGVLFRDSQSQATWTKVSVPSILTSLYPTTHGITQIPDRMPASAVTIAEAFRQAGYATWATSSVAFSGQMTNLHQGVEVLHESASVRDAGIKTARPFSDRLLLWLEEHREVPFFVFLHVMDPHSPFEPRPPYNNLWADPTMKEVYQREMDRAREFMPEGLMKLQGMPTRGEMEQADIDIEPYLAHEHDWYDGSIRGMDAEVGRLMEKLGQLGLAERTLVAFISDHGEEFLEHGRHWHGNTVYGEMTNVPLILHWPAHLPAGKVVEETVQSIDLMPTLLELSGLSAPETAQGQSLVPLLGEDFPGQWQSRPAFSERVRQGTRYEDKQVDSLAIVTDGWKLIHNVKKPDDFPEYELFDHNKDPLNLKDVAGENPEVVERLSQQLEQWHERALAARLPSDGEATSAMSVEELERLRSLGYIR